MVQEIDLSSPPPLWVPKSHEGYMKLFQTVLGKRSNSAYNHFLYSAPFRKKSGTDKLFVRIYIYIYNSEKGD
jgi:hypothetical protein